jgi:hypothetical protein
MGMLRLLLALLVETGALFLLLLFLSVLIGWGIGLKAKARQAATAGGFVGGVCGLVTGWLSQFLWIFSDERPDLAVFVLLVSGGAVIGSCLGALAFAAIGRRISGNHPPPSEDSPDGQLDP